MAALGHLTRDLRDCLDRSVLRPRDRRQAALFLQGRAVSADRTAVAARRPLPPAGAEVLAARFRFEGETPTTRRKLRRIRSAVPNPQELAIHWLDRMPLSSAARAVSTRKRSTALAGPTPSSARKRRAKCRGLMRQ